MTAEAPSPTWRRRETLSSQVVRTIAERIKLGEYPRGSKLPTEKALIDELGVSRTVVREAIANLRASGLVSIHHGIGVFVRQDAGVAPFRLGEENLMLVENLVKGLELRIGIESEAAALAADRRTQADIQAMTAACKAMDVAVRRASRDTQADFDFHRAVATASHNEHFFRIFNYLGETLMPRMRLSTHAVDDASLSVHLARVGEEHRAILKAIEARDVEGARGAMRRHLGDSRDRMLERLRQQQ
ncbi:FadR family transcriptional regulator [Neorhizobium galegae]|uniref:FadR/GntR family transcriptional regulator n=1 Tax=Neorhizobium galegae TaxID=399 RepID=UPI0006217AAC|nr:FadR/GntR family transcriptional regulator [Neorhizobium galegae]MCQ1766682.1 FadR family transcriptional regulator [Neorhizobium galegae]MCQ1845692.1 FadR family transcriptional regulator [Neorhizobium galegae]CDZ42516.1 GntR domain protein [Neorhizobium galegae bv. officinalis]